MRLQKYLAQCGVASRRKSEEYIAAGRVAVNGVTVTEMGVTVEEGDAVTVDGRPVEREKTVCILFYKPSQVMCTSSDPQGRPIVADYFKKLGLRLYTVGRLDYDTEGLLIVTNDGELANALTHPRHQIEKTYYVVCRDKMTREQTAALRNGVEVDGKLTLPAKVKVLRSDSHNTRLFITIREGRNRQVRKMCYAVGHDVTFLRREQVGFLTLEGLEPGGYRYLDSAEVARLKTLAGCN